MLWTRSGILCNTSKHSRNGPSQPTNRGWTHAAGRDSPVPKGKRETQERRSLFLLWGVWSHANLLSWISVKSQSSLGGVETLVSGSAQFDTPHSRLLLPATLTWGDTKKKMVTLKAFVDSGAADNFLDIELANNLCIRPIGSGMITFRTVPLHLTIENDHSETISFYLIESSKEPLILGYPWLRLHNPQFSWASGTLLCWGFACKDSCTPPASCVAGSKDILAAVEEVSACSWNNQLDLTSIPPEYYDLREVFSKQGATSLPPHRPYDCAIELLSGTLPPRGHLYSLSAPETKAMN